MFQKGMTLKLKFSLIIDISQKSLKEGVEEVRPKFFDREVE
jgi:hypothetical protein